MMYGDWAWGNGWGWIAGSVMFLLFWGVVIAGLVIAVRVVTTSRDARTSPHPVGPRHPGPEAVLADRYARGEIDDDEYHRRLATLRSVSPPGDTR
ncbi:SHOCT domain-containing protein [Mycolicibacterium palauense]|uniref:SHOCT domain-containing protein n=1 Tax=Mycolicibacterium palauense TaxID=2034511 RepID=UPI000BFED6F3|nr:SHOCT domain-containing protein [Mycolicibacterium palauense]